THLPVKWIRSTQMSRKPYGSHTGIQTRSEVPAEALSLPAHRVRSHGVPVLWKVSSHRQSMTGNYSGAYISWMSPARRVRPASVRRKAEPELSQYISESVLL